jgi:3-dehydroquinate dehydratase-2
MSRVLVVFGANLELLGKREPEIYGRVTLDEIRAQIAEQAFTHTSIAIRDALLALHVPSVEVHLSNIFAREDFRKKSMISDVVTGVVSGLGAQGVVRAFDALCDLIENRPGRPGQETRESSRNLRESS